MWEPGTQRERWKTRATSKSVPAISAQDHHTITQHQLKTLPFSCPFMLHFSAADADSVSAQSKYFHCLGCRVIHTNLCFANANFSWIGWFTAHAFCCWAPFQTFTHALHYVNVSFSRLNKCPKTIFLNCCCGHLTRLELLTCLPTWAKSELAFSTFTCMQVSRLMGYFLNIM